MPDDSLARGLRHALTLRISIWVFALLVPIQSAMSGPQARVPELRRMNYGATRVAAPSDPLEGQYTGWSQLETPGGTAGWDFGGARHEVLPNGAEMILALFRATPVRIAIPVRMTFLNTPEVRVDLIVRGADLTIDAHLLREEQVVSSAQVTLGKAAKAGRAALRFPMVVGEPLTCDTLVLEFPAGNPPVGFKALAILDMANDGRVPPQAFGGMALVELDGDARRATCIETGQAGLEQTFLVEFEDQQLRFSHALPKTLREAGPAPQLVLQLRAGDAEGQRHSFSFAQAQDATPLWKEESIELGDFLGQRVTAHFELLCDSQGSRFAVLGEAHLVRPRPNPPSVLLITSSSHRADHVGYAGASGAPVTVFLDALAREGLGFTNAAASTNGTSASQIAIMTGLPAGQSGRAASHEALLPAAQTLAERFAQLGYATLASVSAEVLNSRTAGLGQGFDRYSNPGPDDDRDCAQTVEQLRRWLGDYEDRALFVWLHLDDASGPYEPPAEIVWRYYPRTLNPRDPASPVASPQRAPDWDPTISDPMYTEALYDAALTHIDEVLGGFVAETRFRNAALAYTADHGECLRKGGAQRFSHRGLSWANLAVPLIFRGPGLPADALRTSAVLQSDVGRSLLTLAGYGAEEFAGRDLLASSAADPTPRFAIEEEGRSAALLLGDWMLRVPLRDPGADAELEIPTLHRASLFEVTQDDLCRLDLAQLQPERLAQMRVQLMEWLTLPRGTGWSWVDRSCPCQACRAAR